MQVVGPWEPSRESAKRRTTGRQGRTAEMKELAGEMLPIFQAAGVHREALAALAVFQQAAAREAATLELVEEVAARQDPGLRFGGEEASGEGVEPPAFW